MNAKFYDLSKEKQNRILNGALKVFSGKGYRHASTDDVVREAGISKGLLFHYFGSKLEVYRFIYEYSVRYMSLELSTAFGASETDPFVLLKKRERARMVVMRGYPYMQQFLSSCETESEEEAQNAIRETREQYREGERHFLERMSFDTLPEGVDGRRFVKMLEYAMQGLLKEHLLAGDFRPERYYEEAVGMLEMMRVMAQPLT